LQEMAKDQRSGALEILRARDLVQKTALSPPVNRKISRLGGEKIRCRERRRGGLLHPIIGQGEEEKKHWGGGKRPFRSLIFLSEDKKDRSRFGFEKKGEKSLVPIDSEKDQKSGNLFLVGGKKRPALLSIGGKTPPVREIGEDLDVKFCSKSVGKEGPTVLQGKKAHRDFSGSLGENHSGDTLMLWRRKTSAGRDLSFLCQRGSLYQGEGGKSDKTRRRHRGGRERVFYWGKFVRARKGAPTRPLTVDGDAPMMGRGSQKVERAGGFALVYHPGKISVRKKKPRGGARAHLREGRNVALKLPTLKKRAKEPEGESERERKKKKKKCLTVLRAEKDFPYVLDIKGRAKM